VIRRVASLASLIGLMLVIPQPVVAQPAVPACQRSDGTALRDVHWQHTQPKHPLIGEVFKGDRPIATESRSCKRTPLQQLIVEVWDVVRGGGIVLLGEVHDNPEHHAVRGDILRPRLEKLAPTQQLHPGAVFEHIRTTQQPQLDSFYKMAARSGRPWRAPELLKELGWKDSGWPAAEIYYPLFEAALRAHMRVYPGNADRQRMRVLARGDRSGATAEELALLELAKEMPERLMAALAAELAQSHCGALPGSALPAMGLAQRYTDAHLAAAVVGAAREHGGAFLLAGDGHVRTDRGVPWYVHRLAPQTKVVAVTLVEVEDGEADAAGYLPRDPDGKIASDYILFTPRHIRPDPCAKMRNESQSGKQ
jgi:uncharacterized iron-regulated protein